MVGIEASAVATEVVVSVEEVSEEEVSVEVTAVGPDLEVHPVGSEALDMDTEVDRYLKDPSVYPKASVLIPVLGVVRRSPALTPVVTENSIM